MTTPKSGVTYRGLDLAMQSGLFEPTIERDPWIHYHATSSLSETSIDGKGIEWTKGLYTAQEVRDVVGVFDSINWVPDQLGGYSVLKAYSLGSDFQGSDHKPTYFRERAMRSLCYATKEFAGGETARGLRLALRDLDRYSTDESLRAEHYERSRSYAISQAQQGQVPSRVIRVNCVWLQEVVAGFADLRKRCEDYEQRYEHGVVYAVRFTREDVPWLTWCGASGLRCYKPLPKERIVDKVRITDCTESMGVRPLASQMPDDVEMIALLLAVEAAGQAYKVAAQDGLHQSSCRNPRAGIDESEEIARQFGSPALAEVVRKVRRA